MANRNKGRPQFSKMTKFMLDDSLLRASQEYTGKDFSKVVNAMVRSIESQIADKIKVDVENINGMLKASFIAPTLKKDAILKAMQATRGALPASMTGYKDINDTPLNYNITSSDLENVYLKKTVKGKKARSRLESNVAKMQGDVVYTGEEDKAYVRLLKDPSTATPSTEEYLKQKAGKGVGALNKEEQKNRDDTKAKEDEKKKKEEDREKEREEAKSQRLLLGSIGVAVMILKQVYDVAKRILTSIMQFSVAEKTRQVQENTLNIGRGKYLKNQYVSTASGLGSDVVNEAVQAVQEKFGNITELDEKSIEKLALVMGNRVQDLIKSGMGGNNPQALTEEIVNSFYQRVLRGENSVGQQVGQAQARRELVSYLSKIEPNLAKMLTTMLELNTTGALKGSISSWQDVVNALLPMHRLGVNELDYNAVSAFGQELNRATANLASFGNDLKAWAVKYLGFAVDKINDAETFLTPAQRAEKALQDAKTREGRLGQLNTRQSENKAFMTARLSALGIDTSSWKESDIESVVDFMLTGKGLNKTTKKYKDILEKERKSSASGEETTLISRAIAYSATADMIESLSKQKKGYKEFTYSDEKLEQNQKALAEKASKNLYATYLSGTSDIARALAVLISPMGITSNYRTKYEDLNPEMLTTVKKGLGLYLGAKGTDTSILGGTYGARGYKYKSAREVLEAFQKGVLDEETLSTLMQNYWNLISQDKDAQMGMGLLSFAVNPSAREASDFLHLAYEQSGMGGLDARSVFAQKVAEHGISSYVSTKARELREQNITPLSYNMMPVYDPTTNTTSIHVTIDGTDKEGKPVTHFVGNYEGGQWDTSLVNKMNKVTVSLEDTGK